MQYEDSKSGIAADFIRALPDKTLPARTIARMLMKAHPDLWEDIESARSAVRTVTGTSGNTPKRQARVREDIRREKGASGKSYTMPKSYERTGECVTPYILTGSTIGIIGDLHIPYQNNKATLAALEKFEDSEVDTVLLNGDICDFYTTSFHEKIKERRPSTAEERDEVIEFLMLVKDRFPDAQVIYKEGNHEQRLARYVMQKAPELAGLPELELPKFFALDELGIKYIGNGRRMYAGRLNILHGHELGYGIMAPVSPARGLYLRTKSTALACHHHKTSWHSESSIDNNDLSCWTVGCLCDISPEWKTISYWNHGCAIVRVDQETKDFKVENIRIVDGKCETVFVQSRTD